jgi:hypothetical protein
MAHTPVTAHIYMIVDKKTAPIKPNIKRKIKRPYLADNVGVLSNGEEVRRLGKKWFMWSTK